MAARPRIIAIAGSTRTGSLNKKLLALAAAGAREAGAQVTVVDLRDLPMPLYDGDLEASGGLPENARKLKELLAGHQGLLLASPEHNSSIASVLKNAIDWISRSDKASQDLSAFEGKVAGLMSASPSPLGGLRGLVTARSILGNIRVTVLPDQVTIAKAHEAFDEQGNLKEAWQAKAVRELGAKVTRTVAALSPEN